VLTNAGVTGALAKTAFERAAEKLPIKVKVVARLGETLGRTGTATTGFDDLRSIAVGRLLLENIDPEENPKYFLTSVARGFEIIRAVNHPQVQFLYDFFHEQISEGNLIEKLEKNIELVGLVHVADVPGRHEPGSGEINYQNIFRKLAELKYDRVVAMEFLPSGDPVTQLRAAAKLAAESVTDRKQ